MHARAHRLARAQQPGEQPSKGPEGDLLSAAPKTAADVEGELATSASGATSLGNVLDMLVAISRPSALVRVPVFAR